MIKSEKYSTDNNIDYIGIEHWRLCLLRRGLRRRCFIARLITFPSSSTVGRQCQRNDIYLQWQKYTRLVETCHITQTPRGKSYRKKIARIQLQSPNSLLTLWIFCSKTTNLATCYLDTSVGWHNILDVSSEIYILLYLFLKHIHLRCLVS